jgi:Uma2 family endonuclease
MFAEVGVRAPGSELTNFRVPDLAFVAASRLDIFREGWIDGGPDVVIEVRSPGDETYEKMPFYAALGVPEMVVIDRDTKRVELFRLAGAQFVAATPDLEGWVLVEALAVRIKTGAHEGKPVVLVRDEATGAVEDTRDPV